jgi:hypothetical protein
LIFKDGCNIILALHIENGLLFSNVDIFGIGLKCLDEVNLCFSVIFQPFVGDRHVVVENGIERIVVGVDKETLSECLYCLFVFQVLGIEPTLSQGEFSVSNDFAKVFEALVLGVELSASIKKLLQFGLISQIEVKLYLHTKYLNIFICMSLEALQYSFRLLQIATF